MDVSERGRAEENDEIFLGNEIFSSAEKMLKHISAAPADHCAPAIAGELADRCNVKNIGTFFEKKSIVSVHVSAYLRDRAQYIGLIRIF